MKVFAEIKTLVAVKQPHPSFIILRPYYDNNQPYDKVVPIWIGYTEALHLCLALENHHFERPTTHDLLVDVMTNLDSCVEYVSMSKVEGTKFFATLALNQYGREILLDARPSDALAIAIRQSAPLYIEEEVIASVGCPLSLAFEKPYVTDDKELAEFKEFLKDLTPDDFTHEEDFGGPHFS
jgi:bifunctional DNase/RNase